MGKSKKSDGQSKMFIEKARELECDEGERAFDEKLKRIAKAKKKLQPSQSSK